MNSQVVYIAGGKVWTDSKKLAGAFGSRHADVLRKIESILADSDAGFNERNFALVEEPDAKGENRPLYRMTRDGFFHIALTFTGKKGNAFRVEVIEEFTRMEQELIGAGMRQKEVTPDELIDRMYSRIKELRTEVKDLGQENKGLKVVVARSKIGPNDLDILDAAVSIKSAELHKNLKDLRRGQVKGLIRRLVKAKYSNATEWCTYKEVAVEDFDACVGWVSKLTTKHINLAGRFKNTRESLSALKASLEMVGENQ